MARNSNSSVAKPSARANLQGPGTQEGKNMADHAFRANALQTKDHIAFLHGGTSEISTRTDLKVGQSVYQYGNNGKHTEYKIAGFKKPSKSQMGKYGDSPHDQAKHTSVSLVGKNGLGQKTTQKVKAFKLSKTASAPDFFTKDHSYHSSVKKK